MKDPKYTHVDLNVEQFIRNVWTATHNMQCKADVRILRDICAKSLREYRMKQTESQKKYAYVDNTNPPMTSCKYVDVDEIGDFYGQHNVD